MILPLLPLVLVLPTTTLTLDEAVARAREAAAAKDGPDAIEIEAERLEEGGVEVDDVRFSVEHRAVQRFFVPEINNDTNLPYGATDDIGIGALLPLPPLDNVVRRSAADLRAAAKREALKENARELARDVRRLVVHVAALKRERALLADALETAQQREALLQARRESGVATSLEVDAAGRERIALAADVIGVDDDLQQARADLATLLDDDVDVEDDLEARCQMAVPEPERALTLAHAANPRQAKLRLLDEALAREEMAGWLAFVPWPARVQGLYIRRAAGTPDDVRLGLDINLPVFRFLDGEDDAATLRRQANARERSLFDARLSREVQQAHAALAERKKMVGLLTLPAPSAQPEDPAAVTEIALQRNLAERRRLRAIARCARAAVDVVSLVSD